MWCVVLVLVLVFGGGVECCCVCCCCVLLLLLCCCCVVVVLLCLFVLFFKEKVLLSSFLLYLFLSSLFFPLFSLLFLFFFSLLFSPPNTIERTDQPTRRPTSRHLNVIWRRVSAQQSVLSLLLSPPSSLLPLPSSKKKEETFYHRNISGEGIILHYSLRINSEKSQPGEITVITVLYQFENNQTATRQICNYFGLNGQNGHLNDHGISGQPTWHETEERHRTPC